MIKIIGILFGVLIANYGYAGCLDKATSQSLMAEVNRIKDGDDQADYYPGETKSYSVDINGDELSECVALYTVSGFNGSNAITFYMSVFGVNGKLISTVMMNKSPWGTWRYTDMEKPVSLEKGNLIIPTLEFDKGDGNCCPSLLGKAYFRFDGKGVVEIKAEENKVK